MAAIGINSIRTYTVPPRWLLDLADRHGLAVMVGLAWEQHVAFLDDNGRPRQIEQRLKESIHDCADHAAVLGYTIGNEIPAPVVRWHGRRRIERHLHRLYEAVKAEDPEALVTYVNYPPTEYLELPFLDYLCFNVYLEAEERLEAYLAHIRTSQASGRSSWLRSVSTAAGMGSRPTHARCARRWRRSFERAALGPSSSPGQTSGT